MIAQAAVLCIGTDGRFHVENFNSLEDAGRAANIDTESGIPAMVIDRRTFVRLVANGEEMV